MKASVWPDQVLAGGAALSSTYVGPSTERLPEPWEPAAGSMLDGRGQHRAGDREAGI